MTGIERLRELIKDYRAGDECESIACGALPCGPCIAENLLEPIADQIEGELRDERDRWDSELCEAQMDKHRAMTFYLEMNRHVSGVEGAEDSPVARWARELRDALKSDTSDSADAQNPSCADTADAADVTSEAQKVTRDPAEDVSMSAYDLLPTDERDAIAWVREHGGLEEVELAMKNLLFGLNETCVRLGIECSGSTPRDYQSVWREIRALKSRLKESVPRAAYERHLARRQRQIDESHAALRRKSERIGFLVSELNRANHENHEMFMRRAGDYTAFADEVCKRLASELRYMEGCSKDVMDAALHALDRRLMPEGMEWLVEAWPRFEDGEPLRFGDMALIDGEADMVEAVQLWIHGRPVIYGDGGSQQLDKGERVKRPAPKDSWQRLEEDASAASCVYFGVGNRACEDCDHSSWECSYDKARDLVRRAKALAGGAK